MTTAIFCNYSGLVTNPVLSQTLQAYRAEGAKLFLMTDCGYEETDDVLASEALKDCKFDGVFSNDSFGPKTEEAFWPRALESMAKNFGMNKESILMVDNNREALDNAGMNKVRNVCVSFISRLPLAAGDAQMQMTTLADNVRHAYQQLKPAA